MSGVALGGKRATREEIDNILKKLSKLGFEDLCEKYEVCGSYRRGKSDSGDIDIVLIPKDKNSFDEWFESLDVPKRKGLLADNILIDEVQIDFFIADENTYPTMVMMWTGSRGFNIMMRGKSRKAGYVYTRNGMYDINSKEIVSEIKTESDIFNLIGLDYVAPERR